MHRLFVGLRPLPDVRRLLGATMAGVPGARWQDDGQLHVTLRFIGEVDGRVAEDVMAALSGVEAPPPTLALAGVGRFDRRGRANALWAGVTPREPLAALHRKIDAALVRAGLEPEHRAYLPHVTLARLNAPLETTDRWLADHAALAIPAFTLDAFYLFESHLGRDGARYDAVARYRLG